MHSAAFLKRLASSKSPRSENAIGADSEKAALGDEQIIWDDRPS
jgi:hypothetical protein